MGERRYPLGLLAVRETVFLVGSSVAAWLFLHHEILYMDGGYAPRPLPPAAYLVSAAIAYAFAPGLAVLAAWRVPRGSAGDDVCRECGQPLEHEVPPHVRGRAAPASDLTVAARRAVAEARVALLQPPARSPFPHTPVANRTAEGAGRDILP